MGKRSRRRRVLTGGAPGWLPGFGPGEPHGPDPDDPDAPPFDHPEGGVREPRRPKPAPPSLAAEAPLPQPPVAVRERALEVTGPTRV
ncbi:hypothetical protein [Thermoactinospora rubra]|uniref:hypothetical protein n=1 Tax=Thermoactinospora rubra TaxID=1088767 RepID=UPI000A0F6A46|nr:hypothetical protein [Thermoactinospora rubra]